VYGSGGIANPKTGSTTSSRWSFSDINSEIWHLAIGLDLAVRMTFLEVFRYAIRIDTVLTTHIYQNHVLVVHKV
jgi:hypothetical protein